MFVFQWKRWALRNPGWAQYADAALQFTLTRSRIKLVLLVHYLMFHYRSYWYTAKYEHIYWRLQENTEISWNLETHIMYLSLLRPILLGWLWVGIMKGGLTSGYRCVLCVVLLKIKFYYYYYWFDERDCPYRRELDNQISYYTPPPTNLGGWGI